MGLFFASDIAGSVSLFDGRSVGINYWSHVGGYVFGFAWSYLTDLHKAAARESLMAKSKHFNGTLSKKKAARRIYTDILQQEPENEEALRYFMKLNRLDEKKSAEYYARLMGVLMKTDFPKAVKLFDERYPNDTLALPGPVLLKLGMHFYNIFDFQKARLCLEFAALIFFKHCS